MKFLFPLLFYLYSGWILTPFHLFCQNHTIRHFSFFLVIIYYYYYCSDYNFNILLQKIRIFPSPFPPIQQSIHNQATHFEVTTTTSKTFPLTNYPLMEYNCSLFLLLRVVVNLKELVDDIGCYKRLK